MPAAGFRYYNSTAQKLEEGHGFLYRGESYVAKTVKRDGTDVFVSAEKFDRETGDDLGLEMMRLSPQTRIRVMALALGF